MVNVILRADEIQEKIVEIRDRTNQQIEFYNMLPSEIQGNMDTQVWDDIDYLLRYITALHGIIDDMTSGEKDERNSTFEL